MTKRVLVTGATGFVGNQIVLAAKSFGYTVIACCRKGSTQKLIGQVDDVLEVDDLFAQTSAWWTIKLQNVDSVIHCAWYVEPGRYLNSPKQLNCVVGSIELAKGAINANVQEFVSLGTCFEYDLSYELLSTGTPLNPSTLYGASKSSLFLLLRALFAVSKTRFIWPRLFYLFGEHEHTSRLAKYVEEESKHNRPVHLGDGNKVRDYMRVDKAAEEIVQLLTQKQTGPTNICSGVGISIREFASNIARSYKNEHNLYFDSTAKRAGDPERVVGVKGF